MIVITRAIALATFVVLAACSGNNSADSSNADTYDDAHTLHVIAGSELKDLEPAFATIAAKTGIHIAPVYSGTLAGIDRIESGEPLDAAWFANARYLLLRDATHRVVAHERTMLSPVVIGVKASVAKRFGWTPTGVTWKEIGERAAAGQFHFAMTNPASSNSGFSTLIAVASSLAGTADALRPSDVRTGLLDGFFRGQALTAGSSGWLVDAYVRDQDRLDGIVNYESTLIALNRGSSLHEPLVLLYPKEGVVTADYPLVLLDAKKRAAYDAVVAYVKGDDFGRSAIAATYRRRLTPGAPLPPGVGSGVVNEVAFPNSAAAVDGILSRYLNENRVAAHTYYVIDRSGSMEGERLDDVRAALGTLAGDDPSLTGRFARFADRERITLLSFSDDVDAPVDYEMHGANDRATLGAVKAFAAGLHAGGSTAIYCALEASLARAARDASADRGRYSSIVLMTDGENNRCDDLATFERKYSALPPERRLKIFPILFGEGAADDLRQIANLSGGRLFDAKNESLATVFKEIRGYQ